MEWLSKWKAIIQTPPSPLPFNIFLFSPFQIPPNALAPPSQAIHHARDLIPPVRHLSFLSLLIMLPCVHRLNLLFCSLTSSFMCPCVPSSVTTHLSLLSSLLFSLFPFLPLPLFTSSFIRRGAINRSTHKETFMNKNTWGTSRFYFEVSANSCWNMLL